MAPHVFHQRTAQMERRNPQKHHWTIQSVLFEKLGFDSNEMTIQMHHFFMAKSNTHLSTRYGSQRWPFLHYDNLFGTSRSVSHN